MRRLSACLAAVWLPLSQPLLVGSVGAGATVLSLQATAHAQSAEAVGKIAEAITVRIEGATQGSGVLVRREGNRYTVLTAWHVVADQKPGEELDIYTSDGKRHSLAEQSIKRIENIDMATLAFNSEETYTIAQLESVSSVNRNASTIVAGFQNQGLGAVKTTRGIVVANSDIGIDQGYRLIYTSPTKPGFSGGPVLNSNARVVAIHGRGEIDPNASRLTAGLVKTGANQGVPIDYYIYARDGIRMPAKPESPVSADALIAEAILVARLNNKAAMYTAIRLLDRAIEIEPLPDAYLYRGEIRRSLNNQLEGLGDMEAAYILRPDRLLAAGLIHNYYRMGMRDKATGLFRSIDASEFSILKEPDLCFFSEALAGLGLRMEALAMLDTLFVRNPERYEILGCRAMFKKYIGDLKGAHADYKLLLKYTIPHWLVSNTLEELFTRIEGPALAIKYFDQLIAAEPPDSTRFYEERASAKDLIGDSVGASQDRRKVLDLKAKILASNIKAFKSNKNKKITDYIAAASDMREAGDRDGAIAAINQAIMLLDAEGREETYSSIYEWCIRNGSTKAANDVIENAIRRFPKAPWAYDLRAKYRGEALNDLIGKINDLRRSAELSEYNFHEVDRWIEAVKAKNGHDTPEVIDIYNMAISHNPGDASLRRFSSLAKEQAGDLKGALDDISKAIEIDPYNINYLEDRASLLSELEMHEKGVRDIRRAISLLDYQDSQKIIDFAEWLDGEEALRLINIGIENSNSTDGLSALYTARAEQRFFMGDWEGACSDHLEAIAKDRENRDSMEWLNSEGGSVCKAKRSKP